MKRDISAYHVGASLYVPATHAQLESVLEGKFSELKSVIIDFEDAIDENSVVLSTRRFIEVLQNYTPKRLLVFVRPRNSEHFKDLLSFGDIDRVDGFVFAKFDTQTMQAYYDILPKHFWSMPVLESSDIFEADQRLVIRDFLRAQSNVLMLRVGGEDLSSQLLLRRGCEKTLYDLPAMVQLVSQLILEFKPLGFVLSAPVFSCYKEQVRFEEELKGDKAMGLFGKTIIHPSQIEATNKIFSLTAEEAKLLDKLEATSTAIDTLEGDMIEHKPHSRLRYSLQLRKTIYGTS